jgi:chloramphenicol 3-O-phosphotransferase
MQKDKITEKQFILILDGPSCGGKTTVANVIMDMLGGIFDAKNDQIKWLISDYSPTAHGAIVDKMMVEAIRVAIKNGLSILKQGTMFGTDGILQIAKELGVPVFTVNISAPKEILDERFLERIEAKKKGAKISNVDPDRFTEIYNTYLKKKMNTPLEFDSSIQSPEEIVYAIFEHIRSNDAGQNLTRIILSAIIVNQV